MMATAEANFYRDIRRIAKALEGIERHLSVIAKSYEPITFNMGETDMTFNTLKHEDDGK
jgi:hypothetical protein